MSPSPVHFQFYEVKSGHSKPRRVRIIALVARPAEGMTFTLMVSSSRIGIRIMAIA